MPDLLSMEARRFHDGGLPARAEGPGGSAGPGGSGEGPNPREDPRIVLERHAVEGSEQFAMLRRIAYRDRRFGTLLVPADPETFRTDLTSVPAIFTWLVPKTGAHLPAALLHDGLVHGPDEDPTYVSVEGHLIDRVEADRVFRDAMGDTGTGIVRRWLVWSAVATATLLVSGAADWSGWRRWRHRAAVVITLLVIGVLGVWATLDLFDVAGVPALPWMGERAWWMELLGGFAGAVVIPLLLCLLWGRFAVAGAVMGIGLAVLLHVTLGVLAVTGLYWAVEHLASRRPFVAAGLAVGLGVGAVGVLLGFVLGG